MIITILREFIELFASKMMFTHIYDQQISCSGFPTHSPNCHMCLRRKWFFLNKISIIKINCRLIVVVDGEENHLRCCKRTIVVIRSLVNRISLLCTLQIITMNVECCNNRINKQWEIEKDFAKRLQINFQFFHSIFIVNCVLCLLPTTR
jgi:hypothetical protein